MVDPGCVTGRLKRNPYRGETERALNLRRGFYGEPIETENVGSVRESDAQDIIVDCLYDRNSQE